MFIIIPVLRCKKYSSFLAKGWVFSYFFILKWDFHTETLKIGCDCPETSREKIFFPLPLLWGSSFTWTLPQKALVQLYFAFGKRTHLEISWHFWFAGVAGRRITMEGKASPEHLYSSGISNQKVRKRKSYQEEYTSQISFSSRLLYGNPSLIEKATELQGVYSRPQGFFCSKDAAPGRPKEKVASALCPVLGIPWIPGLESNLNWTSLLAAGVSQLRAPQCQSLEILLWPTQWFLWKTP